MSKKSRLTPPQSNCRCSLAPENANPKLLTKYSQPWPFPYGYHVAFCAIMMTIVTLFSVTVPLVAPAGALFFGAKLAADKYDILVLCPPDSEKEAGLSYGKIVPVVTVSSLILFNAAMFAQFLLLKASGPASMAGICLVLSILSCLTWAVFAVRDRRRMSAAAAAGSDAGAGHMQLDVAQAADEAKERALLVRMGGRVGDGRGVGGGAVSKGQCRSAVDALCCGAPPHASLQTSHTHPLLRCMSTLPEFI